VAVQVAHQVQDLYRPNLRLLAGEQLRGLVPRIRLALLQQMDFSTGLRRAAQVLAE